MGGILQEDYTRQRLCMCIHSLSFFQPTGGSVRNIDRDTWKDFDDDNDSTVLPPNQREREIRQHVQTPSFPNMPQNSTAKSPDREQTDTHTHACKHTLGSGGGSRPKRIFSCFSFQVSRLFMRRSFFRSLLVRKTWRLTGLVGSEGHLTSSGCSMSLVMKSSFTFTGSPSSGYLQVKCHKINKQG